MKRLCPSIRQSLKWLNSTACSHKCVSWSNHLKNLSIMVRRLCFCDHIKEITQSYLVLQCERNSITSKEHICLKTIIDWERECPWVKYTRWNMSIMSHAPMWKRMFDLLWGIAMTQKNPSSTERSLPRHNGHLKNNLRPMKVCPNAMHQAERLHTR